MSSTHDDFWNKGGEEKKLNANFDTALSTTLLQSRKQVGNVIPRVSVQTRAETLLVKVVCNQTNATAQDEQTIEHTHAHVVFDLFGGESSAVAQQIHEADCYTSVDVQDKVVLLGGSDGLNSNGVIEQLGAGEVLLGEFLDQLNTEVGVVTGLNSVTDTGD